MIQYGRDACNCTGCGEHRESQSFKSAVIERHIRVLVAYFQVSKER